MLAMLRTHRLAHDLAWLPPSVRRRGKVATAAVWSGAAVMVGAAAVAAPAATVLVWKGLVLAGASLGVAGQRIGHAVFQRGLRKLARGDVALADVGGRDEGELVVVRGRIEATTPITGWLTETSCVYRRLVWEPEGVWVSEAAVDFALVDGDGHRVLVQAGGARWMVGRREPWVYPIARFDNESMPERMRELARAAGPSVRASERCLEVGAEVQVVGYKTASADAGGEVLDYRLPPMRATLRSGPTLPLVITRIADLDRPGEDDG